jgi:hypothetical protein
VADDDWRLQGQDEYLSGRTLRWATWWPYREGWDHDHCEFCWSEISDQPVDEHVQHNAAWVTEDDDYHWICPRCFEDFREQFAWVVADLGNPPDDPERQGFRGKGTAYITWWDDPVDGSVWRGYWDLAPDDPGGGGRFLEDSGFQQTAALAIAWAKQRTSRVVVTPRDSGPQWAGDGPTPGGLERFVDQAE